MHGKCVIQAAILYAVTLQLQSASGSPHSWEGNEVAFDQDPLTDILLVQNAMQVLKAGFLHNEEKSVCDHFQRVLQHLNSSEKLDWVTYGSPPPDHSLLNAKQHFWEIGSTQQQDLGTQIQQSSTLEGPTLFASSTEEQSVSLTDALLPNQTSHLPQNRLLNITYDCAQKQLSLHIEISTEVDIMPHLLSFNGLIFSLQVTMHPQPAFKAAILSGDTFLFGVPTFVAIKHDFNTEIIEVKGIPIVKISKTIQNAIKVVSGGSLLSAPPGISDISDISFLGEKERYFTIALVGKSDGHTVILLRQVSDVTNSTSALMAEVGEISLNSFITTVFDVDTSDIPLFGSLNVSQCNFLSTTGEITTSLLSHIASNSNSPLTVFGTTLPKGISAYFTANIAGISMTGTYHHRKLNFEVPDTTSLTLRVFLAHYPRLDVLNSFPHITNNFFNSVISSFTFSPQNKQLELILTVLELPLVPGIIQLSGVHIKLEVIIRQNPSLTFTGTWKMGSLIMSTHVTYNNSLNVYHIMATPKDGNVLNIDPLVRKIVGANLPTLNLSSLTTVAGNIYSNANYFIVMKGNISRGIMYIFFLRNSNGTRVGIAASVESFPLSELLKSTVGADITKVPYLSDLVLPAMVISITSGIITSEALPHIFGPGSPLLIYGNTLPDGVNAKFNLDISGSSTSGEFSNGNVTFTFPESSDFTVEDLALLIPNIAQEMQTLPSELSTILDAKVHCLSYNATANIIKMVILASDLLIEDFLSLSAVEIVYQISFNSTPTIDSLYITGRWHIVGHDIDTDVVYDGIDDEFSITGHVNGQDIPIADLVQTFTAKAISLPSDISSFNLTSVKGTMTDGNMTVVLNGVVGEGKICVVFQLSSLESTSGIVIDIPQFRFADLVLLAMETDISTIPFFGTLQFPRLRFAIATSNISLPFVLADRGSPLEMFRNGLVEGVAGHSLVQIGDVGGVAVNFVKNVLVFRISNSSLLSFNDVLSVMPAIRDILKNLPSKLFGIFGANIQTFSFDPGSNQLIFKGFIEKTLQLVPQFISLDHISISLVIELGTEKHIKEVTFSGYWMLGNIPIHVIVTYDGKGHEIGIAGELSSQIKIKDLITSISEINLSIPPALSFVTLSHLTGNIHDNVTTIVLSGSVSDGHVYLVYQKSSVESAVAIAAHRKNIRLSSVLSSALAVDISNIPYFGTLIIPEIGLTVSSQHINHPLLSSLYPPTSLLTIFGDSISAGVEAAFKVTIGEAKNISVNFVKNKLDIDVPDDVELSVATVLQYIPNLENALISLPLALQDISSGMTVETMTYKPLTEELQLSGRTDTLSIIPDFLILYDCEYVLLGNIGRNSSITLASFEGEWVISSISMITEVIYDNDMFIIDAHQEMDESFSINEFIKGIDFRIPSAFDTVVMTRVIGKVEDGVYSVVFIGSVGNKANISIVYDNRDTVILAADLEQLRLFDLIYVGIGINISQVPYFGMLTLSDVSFILASKELPYTNLPDINVPHIPTLLFLEKISEGVKAQFRLIMGSVFEAIGEYADNQLTIKPPSSVSMSLLDLLSIIPELRNALDSLPLIVKMVKKAKITRIVYNPVSSNLIISLSVNSLEIVPPELLLLEDVAVHINMSITVAQQHNSVYNMQYRDQEELQSFTICTLLIEGIWKLLNMEIDSRVEYSAHVREFIIEGVPSGMDSLNIDELVNKFTATKLTLPPLSSLKLKNINATLSSHGGATIIITTTAGAARVHLLIRTTQTGTTVAVAADIKFTVVDLIKTTLNKDLSSVPFITSLGTLSMAFTTSNNHINSPLLHNIFEPDSLLQAYTEGIPKGVSAYFKVLVGGCLEVEVTYTENVFDFTLPQKCRVTLRAILSEIPVINSVMRVLPSPINDLLASELHNFHFNPSTKTLSISASLQKLDFNDVLQVHDLEISLMATLSSHDEGLIALTFKGNWILNNINVQISVSYDKETQQLSFQAFPKTGLSINHVINGLLNTHLKLPSFVNAARLTKIIGRKEAEMFTFVMSGKVGSTIDVYLVYQKDVGESPHIAVAASINTFRLADIIKEAVHIDISDVPFFRDVQIRHVGLSVAKGSINTPLLKVVLPRNSPLRRYGNTLPDSFCFNFDLSLGGGKMLKGTYTNKTLSFVPSGNVVPLLSLINAIPGIDIDSAGIVTVFKNILQIGLKRFRFNIEKKEIVISMFMDRMSLFGEALLIRDINILLTARLLDQKPLHAEANGLVTLGKNKYDITIHHNPSTNKYVLTLNTEKLPIFGLVSALGAAFLPQDLQILLGKVFDINILNATVSYPFGTVPQHILISGMPQLFGLKTVHVTALMIEQSGGTQLIQKYTLPEFSIADLLKRLFGGSISSKIIGQNAETSLIISPISLEGVSLSVPEFNGVDIGEGLSVFTTLSWPSDCRSDIFCKVMKMLLGGSGKLNLQGTIINARYYSIMASVSDVKLGGGVVLRRAGLRFVGGVEQSLSLVGSIELKSPAVTLNAAIGLTVSGVKLEGSMSGCWHKAFGISFITLCNLYLAMTILPVPPAITGLEFGGRVELGRRKCSNDILTAEAYVGINTINPNENYFYADIGPLTFQTFVDAFCIDISLPTPLADSGFPKGLETSFSLLGKQLPHAGITIPIGFRFKGTINILGLQATVDINISPTRFKVSAVLPPLNILGIFKMYKSHRETSSGPFLHVDISASKMPIIEVSGYVQVLGISVEGRLLISSTKYEAFVEGRFLNLIQASLRITATYSKSVSSAGFEVEGKFKNDLFDRIAKGVRDGLKKSADEASKHISAAQDKLRQMKAKFDSAINSLEGAKRKVEDAKRVFDVVIGKMEGARRKLDGVCRIKSCRSLCIGCPKGWRCCGKVWGKCVCTLPGWDSCCTRVKDPLCLAANAACWLLKKPLDLLLQVAIVIVDKSRHALDVVKVALSVAQGIMHAAKLALDGAIGVLEVVKFTYKIGVSAISALADFALTKIINIQEIHFRVALSEADGGEFMCRVKGVLMGMNLNIEVVFNTRNIWPLIMTIAEKAIVGLGKFIG